MITDEYRMKKNLRALIDVMRLTLFRTTIDFDSNIVKVEFQANLKGLDDKIEDKLKLDMISLGLFKQNHRILTSGITPHEYNIMHKQLEIFQNMDKRCELENIGGHNNIV